jgi:hypothetical protein
MAALFAEQPGWSAVSQASWNLRAPQLPAGPDRPAVDLLLRSGLFLTPGAAAPGRSLSERVIDGLCAALDKSPLVNTLFDLTGLNSGGLYTFRRRGVPNTSSTATLMWSIAEEPAPFDVTVRVVVPDQYGQSHIETLELTLDVVSRLTEWMHSEHAPVLVPAGR